MVKSGSNKQKVISEILSNLIQSQNWEPNYSKISIDVMKTFVDDLISYHISEIYSEALEEEDEESDQQENLGRLQEMNQNLRKLANNLIIQSAIENQAITYQ